MERVVRERERRVITQLGRTGWRELERQGKTPARVNLGLRSYGWLLSDLEAFVRSLRAERPAA